MVENRKRTARPAVAPSISSDLRVCGDPFPALRAIPVAAEVEAPAETCSVDPCPTPFAHAVFPPSYEENGPSSRELLLDDRVERLLRENLELMKERAAMRSIHQQRIERSNELLMEARTAKRLVRACIARAQEDEAMGRPPPLTLQDEFVALVTWAAKTL